MISLKKIIAAWKILGPGLMFAGAAVGVSHLVQSTRAGANYGFELVWVLILANVLKYPFMEYGPRYACATGHSLIEGYKKIGNWALILYLIFTIGSMFAIQAAVTIVTAGLFGSIFNLHISPVEISAFLLIISMIILGLGHYSALDKIIKVVIVTLAISTIIAVVFALNLGFFDQNAVSGQFNWQNHVDILFLIAFVGWMPAPIDVSVWHSLWSVAKEDQLGKRPSLRHTLIDFNIGYIGAAFLGICFLTLGALVMFGSGEKLSADGTVFASQLIAMYTASIGPWAYSLIAIAALTTMFSTVITCLDAYPRVLRKSTELLFPKTLLISKYYRRLYWVWIIVIVAGTVLLLGYLSGTMRFMVDLATTISFVTAPVLAFINFKVITHNHVPENARPKMWLRIYSWLGLVFLTLFSIIFIIWEFIV
ncbi:MAG TPA: Nramp family divalent metal transporter [Bacteroidales bacterium]|nr:Nramp family divalent metal transporter [Bacteroidales bacterium]HPR57589.1 Nramp family divalent metal transporter [Bacteroidales bacterium]HRW96136.1 Nramp family divalent metal transporter [Bacteroidales bacterium]